MVTIPAAVWRGGFVRRVLMIGGAVGLCVGALAWLDSGFLLVGAMVFGIVGMFHGIWLARRMARYWPGAKTLSGEERVRVVRAVRRGEHVADPLLSQPVIEYSRGLHDAAETGRPWRWVLAFVLAVAAATAIWDAVYGSWGNAVASGIYLVALLAELFWWPKWLERLLLNADRAAEMARRSELADQPPEVE